MSRGPKNVGHGGPTLHAGCHADGFPRRRVRRAGEPARRGNVYVAVLSIGLVVAIIGLSALVLARSQFQGMRLNEDAVKADFAAQTMTDVTVFRLANNSNWRATHTHDTWTSNEVVGDATFRYKLVDEIDGNLANDPNQPVRLYGQATVGETVRIYSVLLARGTIINLVTNADLENGTTDWTSYYCTLESRTDSPRSGAACLLVKNRLFYASCAYQDIRAWVEKGVTYTCEFWMKMESGSATAAVQIETVGTSSGYRYVTGSSTSVGTTWTKVTGDLTPTWTGSLNTARVYVYTNNTTAFRIDDVLVAEATSVQVKPIAGTWRREVLP